MPRIHKKMGVGAVVSFLVKRARPSPPFKNHFPNTYNSERVQGTVQGLETDGDGSKWLVVKVATPDVTARVKVGSARLHQAGPPNQWFATAPAAAGGGAGAPAAAAAAAGPPPVVQAVAVEDNEDDTDFESDVEVEDVVVVPVPAAAADAAPDPLAGLWKWQDSVAINVRQGPKTHCRLQGQESSALGVLAMFRLLFPLQYFHTHIKPATNAKLPAQAPLLDEAEFFVWIGLWLWMALQPGYDKRHDFWTRPDDERRSGVWDPPYLGQYMSRNRFDLILQHLTLRNDAPPAYKDRFWTVRLLYDAYNTMMGDDGLFSPSWLVCLDESMMAYLDAYCPGWMTVKRKPHPYGNEIHTIACAESHIIFWMELVEGQSRPKEGPFRKAPLADDLGKTAALVVRMTTSIHGSGRVVALDSGFGYLPSVKELLARGLYSTAVIKKRSHWPKGVPGQAILDHVHGRDVGDLQALVGEGDNDGVWIGAMADSKHTSIMANSWGTTNRTGPTKRRRVGGERVEFQYDECRNAYYSARHAVDDHNNNRQGVLSLEAACAVKDWTKRQFFYVLATVEVNALLAYNHFVRRPKGEPALSKAAFRRMLVEGLVHNAEYSERRRGDDQDGGNRNHHHDLLRLEVFRGKWNHGKKAFPPTTQKYQQYLCAGEGCTRRVRTYCRCDMKIRCERCHTLHCEAV